MALIKGILVSIEGLAAGPPTVVVFQYNPAEVTRVVRLEPGQMPTDKPGSALNAPDRPVEEYSLTIDLDATDGLERAGPLTSTLGISPQLAALEMLMQPVAGVGGAIAGATTASVPSQRLPLVLLIWGPGRVTPVKVTSIRIHETAFDELLNPLQAAVELSLSVLREGDVGENQLAKAAAAYYHTFRSQRAVVQPAQVGELGRMGTGSGSPATEAFLGGLA